MLDWLWAKITRRATLREHEDYPGRIHGRDLWGIHERGLWVSAMRNRNPNWRMYSFLCRFTFVLREMPLPNELCCGGHLLCWPVVESYAQLRTPFPPLVLSGDGAVYDGWHRLFAAQRRGDKTIRVYLPEGSQVPPGFFSLEPCPKRV